ncbi:MAG: hypothetical protein WDN09_03185 [bacterium]
MENNEIHNTNTEVSHEVTIYAEPIFHIGTFEVTNSLITSWFAVLVIFALALAVRLKMKKIPGKGQHVFEVILEGAPVAPRPGHEQSQDHQQNLPGHLHAFLFHTGQ